MSAPDVREAAAALLDPRTLNVSDSLAWARRLLSCLPFGATVTERMADDAATLVRRIDEAMPRVDALRAALASPVAAPVSPPAASRDDVAEVLFNARHLDNAGVPWSDIVASANVGAIVEVDIARRQADAILAKWTAPSRGGEPVEWWAVYDGDEPHSVLPPMRSRRDADWCAAGRPGLRVVALVPQHKEP